MRGTCIKRQFFELDDERIVSNRPAVFYQSILHGVVMMSSLGMAHLQTKAPSRSIAKCCAVSERR
jgi:hypothetical protein